MTGKTHAAVGICGAAFLLVPKVDIKTALVGIGFCIIGSYATDADLKVSKAGHVFTDAIYAGVILTALYLILTLKMHYNVSALVGKDMPSQLKIMGVLLIVGSIVLGRITGHRKYMHSLIGFFVMNLGVGLIAGSFVIWFGLGYALHMIVDLLNEKPEELLFPLHAGDICFHLASSDGILNWVLAAGGYVGFIYKITSIYNLSYLQSIFIK
ncbi:metal-dependent hydrolase [Clostridium akagii]|uniref:metal-dependent hydrolase n=1 Tax=Clostridium akagii TaxID=91623 RepID=UPI000478B84B|nr:metal-dependent hydrolase [Clostridium akagii]